VTTFAYLRVSTDRQDLDNQRHGILEYANSHRLGPLAFVEDAASGRIGWRDRVVGALLLETASGGDLVLFAEVSRMGRSTLQVLEMLETCMTRGLTVYIAKQGMVLDGSMQSRITATVLGLAAEIERALISQRTTEALARRKATARAKGKVERPFRTVKEMHETLFHFHKPETESEVNDWLLRFLVRYNGMQHRSESHSRLEDWLANLPDEGLRTMCDWERFCTFAREPERRLVGVDARIAIGSTQYEVDPDPFQELRYRNAIAAKKAVARTLGIPLARLPADRIAALDALLSETLDKPVIEDFVRSHLKKQRGD
jgi:DNA invertase Pin-like site-specific DNA recombinase